MSKTVRIFDNGRAFGYNVIMDIRHENYSGKIAAMVSGGVDSMVMLDLLISGGADLLVAHVNHKIRDEADSDCAFVQKYCDNRNIPFVKFEFDIPKMAKDSGRSIETEARLARRSVIKELIDSGKADKAALAHHADDNAETILMHVLRGSGVDGLRGIEQSERILRPLLSYTREQIKSYAQAHNVPFVEDKSNYDIAYTRNFIRHEVMPLIKTRYPGAVEALNRLSKNSVSLLDAVDGQLDLSLINERDGAVELSLRAFNSPFASRYVIFAAKKLKPVDVTKVQIDNVIKLAGGKTGSKAELAGGLKAYKEYDKVVFCFDREKSYFCEPFKLGEIKVGDCIIKSQEVQPKPQKGKTVVCAHLPDGCVFRTRQEGDKFVPFGGKSKSLKKYLIDKKIPKRLRDRLVCLCDGNEVLAILGVEISDKCKLTQETDKAYLLEVVYG